MQEITLTTQQAEGLQSFVSNHMDNCMESLDMDDAAFVTEEGEVFEPYGLYCGCHTCNTREQLMATFEYLRKIKVVDIYVQDKGDEN